MDSSPGILTSNNSVSMSTSRPALHCATRTKVNMCFAHLKKNREKGERKRKGKKEKNQEKNGYEK